MRNDGCVGIGRLWPKAFVIRVPLGPLLHREPRLDMLLRSQATPLRVVCGSIATTPFRVVCGSTTTILLPTMSHPSLEAADLRRPDDVYAKFSRDMAQS